MIGQAERLIQLRHLERQMTPAGNILSFCSGKGGTGKTVLALNIAFMLSNAGKKVLLVDCDFNMSNTALMLNQFSENTIYDFFSGKKTLDNIIYEYSSNLHFIFGDNGKIDFPEISGTSIEYFFNRIKQLSPNYDIIIMDNPGGASNLTLNILLNSNNVVVISNTEPTSIMDSYVIHKLLKSKRYSGKIFTVMNKAENIEEGNLAFENLKQAVEHFTVGECIPIGIMLDDKAIAKSIMDQELYLKTYQNTSNVQYLRRICFKIAEINQMANIHQSI